MHVHPRRGRGFTQASAASFVHHRRARTRTALAHTHRSPRPAPLRTDAIGRVPSRAREPRFPPHLATGMLPPPPRQPATRRRPSLALLPSPGPRPCPLATPRRPGGDPRRPPLSVSVNPTPVRPPSSLAGARRCPNARQQPAWTAVHRARSTTLPRRRTLVTRASASPQRSRRRRGARRRCSPVGGLAARAGEVTHVIAITAPRGGSTARPLLPASARFSSAPPPSPPRASARNLTAFHSSQAPRSCALLHSPEKRNGHPGPGSVQCLFSAPSPAPARAFAAVLRRSPAALPRLGDRNARSGRNRTTRRRGWSPPPSHPASLPSHHPSVCALRIIVGERGPTSASSLSVPVTSRPQRAVLDVETDQVPLATPRSASSFARGPVAEAMPSSPPPWLPAILWSPRCGACVVEPLHRRLGGRATRVLDAINVERPRWTIFPDSPARFFSADGRRDFERRPVTWAPAPHGDIWVLGFAGDCSRQFGLPGVPLWRFV